MFPVFSKWKYPVLTLHMHPCTFAHSKKNALRNCMDWNILLTRRFSQCMSSQHSSPPFWLYFPICISCQLNSKWVGLDQNRRLHNTHVCKVALIFKLKIKYIPPQMDILIYLHCIYEMYMRGMRIHRKKTRDSRQKFRLLMEDYIILHKEFFRRTCFCLRHERKVFATMIAYRLGNNSHK